MAGKDAVRGVLCPTVRPAGTGDHPALPGYHGRLPGDRDPLSLRRGEPSAIQSDAGLAVFFSFLHDLDLPVHSHVAQRGMGIEGEMALAVGGETRICLAGDSYSVPGAVPQVVTT